MTDVRTRFAPSPTGYLHVGGVRTTIFSWLLAKHFGGQFLLRIEDTDQERLVPGAIQAIIEDLAWLGISPDEGPSLDELKKVGALWDGAKSLGGPCGPYIQSLRLPRYKEIAEELVKSGAAYRCDCTPEMLAKEREEQAARKETPGYSGYCRHRNVSSTTKHVIRLRIPFDRSMSFMDAVRGRVSWESLSLRDTVVLKSDGFPTYHLAVVCDDHDMRISHALRGEEWLATTPIHLLIYEALGWQPPVIGHLPNVLGNDGKKLSKRHGATFVSAFRDEGYLPEALFNFLVLIGWSPGDGEEQEIFTKEELIKRFSIEKINSAGGIFAYPKLEWMNGVYMRALPDQDFIERIRPFILKAGFRINEERLKFIAPYVKERLKVLKEAPEMVEFLFVDQLNRDMPAMFKKEIDKEKAKVILSRIHQRLESVSDFTIPNVESQVRELAEELSLKPGPMFGVIRIAVTGKTITPPLFESIVALGKNDSLKRIKEAEGLLNG